MARLAAVCSEIETGTASGSLRSLAPHIDEAARQFSLASPMLRSEAGGV